MNTPPALARELPHVLPPAMEKAEIETRRVAKLAGEGIAHMAATRKAVRISEVPGRLWDIVIAVAKTTPIIVFLGYWAWTTDARREETQTAYVAELKASRDALHLYIGANTLAMKDALSSLEKVVATSDRAEKNTTEILRHVSAFPTAPKKLGE